MPVVLALFTCSPTLEVALIAGQWPAPSFVRLAGGAPRSALLIAAVDLLFEDAGLDPDALDSVVVSRGPGSFTGIRAGLATAFGLATAAGIAVTAYDSLSVQAARTMTGKTVWTAMPGRRGEIYARPMHLGLDGVPIPDAPVTIMKVQDAAAYGPWLAPPDVDLGPARRGEAPLSSAEALLRLRARDAPGQPEEPWYVEGPPVAGGPRG